MIVSAAVTGTTTKTLTLTQQDSGTITASWTDDNSGTVTSVGLSAGTSGTDVNVSGSPITSSGTITLNIPTASATNRGALSSTDWSTFNNKQSAITLTTTGTSGAATLVGSTLNIPNYGSALSGYVPYTGATTNVNLASRYLQANYLVVDGQTNATAINFKQYSSVSFLGDGYTGMGSVSVDKMFFNFAQGSNIFKTFYFDVSAITGNATRAYIMPNADGTLALTSQIPTVSGTTNYLSKFTAANTIGNTFITEDANNIVALEGTGTTGGSLNFKHYASLSGKGSGYSYLGASASTWIFNNTSSGGVTKQFYFDITNVSNNTIRQLYIPNASGTLALTSDITSAVSGTTNYIPKFTSSSAIGNSQIQDDGTNVGIGGAPSSQKVRIYGGSIISNASYHFGFTSIGAQASMIGITAGDVLSIGQNNLNHSSTLIYGGTGTIQFSVSGSEQMRLTSTGLGIGTSSPTTKLDVNGDGVKFGNGSDFYFNANTGASGNYYHNQNGGVRYTISPAGNLGIGTSSPARKLDVNGTGRFTGDLTIANSSRVFLNGTTGQDWALRTNSSTGNFEIVDWTTELARITMTASGNLGLGTSSPAVKLDVIGAIRTNNSGNPNYYLSDATSGSTIQHSGNVIYFNSNDNVVTNGGFAWRTSNALTELMRLTSTGLGIGTSSPATKLHTAVSNPTRGIIATIANIATSAQTGTQIHFAQNSVADWVIGQPAGTDAFAFWSGRYPSADGTERMRLDASGNLGLGVTPSAWSGVSNVFQYLN